MASPSANPRRSWRARFRSPHVRGVSVLFLILAVVNQVVWLTWAILVADLGTIIAAGTTGVIALFNLIWYTARRLGVPAVAVKSMPENLRPIDTGEHS